MRKLSITNRELALAWRRMKYDRQSPQRVFVEYPNQIPLIESEIDAWLSSVRSRLGQDYRPGTARVCYRLKSSELFRPGIVLDLEDELIYTCLVGKLFPSILGHLSGHQGDPDVAYQLAAKAEPVKWVYRGVRIFTQWRTKSLSKLEDAAYLVKGDVSGFYENIDFKRLASDLKKLAPDHQEVIHLLLRCLQAWSSPRDRGVPQGYSASDILAKVYMYPIDLDLKNRAVVHLRYVDDFRLFASSRLQARRWIRYLSENLYRRGLSFQTAKTCVVDKAEARREIEGVAPILRDAEFQINQIAHPNRTIVKGYLTPDEIDEMFEVLKKGAGPPIATLERIFLDHFSSDGAQDFNSTLFHFLLNRLAAAGSRIAVSYCFRLLRGRPHETEHIIRYLDRVDLSQDEVDEIAGYMASEDAINDYQLFELLRWVTTAGKGNETLLGLCRRILADGSRDLWLRAYAIAYIGKFGNDGDMESLEALYPSLGSEIERAECVLALKRQEKSRRNRFYSNLSGGSDLVSRAVEAVK